MQPAIHDVIILLGLRYSGGVRYSGRIRKLRKNNVFFQFNSILLLEFVEPLHKGTCKKSVRRTSRILSAKKFPKELHINFFR